MAACWPERVVIAILAITCCVQSTRAEEAVTTSNKTVTYHTLHVETDSTIVFTWEAIRATPNITIRHGNDVSIVTEEVESRELKIIISAANESSVYLLVPSDVIHTICINGECSPVLCELSLVSEYSNVPSNSPIFLDNECTIKKPDRWDEWLTYYFGDESVQQTYYGDFDEDGLVNILEYYGLEAFGYRPYGEAENETEETTTEEIPLVSEIGSDPTNNDTDGDLLGDGFEAYNSLNPKRKDETEADYDKDALSNLVEQLLQLDPLNPDSDGDGNLDGQEVASGTDPGNPANEEMYCTGEGCGCSNLKTCEECVTNTNLGCDWKTKKATCVKHSWWHWEIFGYIHDLKDCPCKKCKDWYYREKAENSTWMNDLNCQFPCPCNVTVQWYGLKPTDASAGKWVIDPACIKKRRPSCDKLHPGADGCLRSWEKTPSGAGQ